MKNIKKIVTLLIMLGVLAAGVYLANKNTETRKGATAAETVSDVLPSTINGTVGTELTTTIRIGTGSGELSAGELRVAYDREKLEYVSLEVSSPFTLFGGVERIDSGSGPLKVDFLSMSEYRSGSVEVAKIKFKPRVNGTSEVKASGSITIKENHQTWTLATNNGSQVTVGSGSGDGTCSRCSVYYKNQRATWQATDCNVSPAIGTNVVRTYDATCTTPSQEKTNCQRCSTVNPKEYVWWEPEAGKTCNDPVTTTVMRAVRDDCTTGQQNNCSTLSSESTCSANSTCKWWTCSEKCYPASIPEGEACVVTNAFCNSFTTKSACDIHDNMVNSLGGCAWYSCQDDSEKCWPRGTSDAIACPVQDECSANTDCTADKVCTGGSCVVATCSGDMPSCKKTQLANHVCTYVADTAKNGQSCQYNSVTTGMCDSGTCKEPATIPDGKKKLSFKTAYRGFSSGAKCGLNEKLKVVVRNVLGDLVEYENVSVSNNGLSEIVIDSGKDIALFVKGSQHLQMKYSVDGQDSRYTQAGGKIETIDNKVYDFTKYPMLPGDVNGDGWINGLDFSIVKTKAMKYEEVAEGGFVKGDLDGTCQVNTRDLTLLVNSLDEKQDELY